MVQKSFDVFLLTEEMWRAQYEAFSRHFQKMMELKHGKRFQGMMAYQYDNIGSPGVINISLEAQLDK